MRLKYKQRIQHIYDDIGEVQNIACLYIVMAQRIYCLVNMTKIENELSY